MLTAPAHLRGRMTRYTPKDLRDERMAWVAASYAAGHSQGDIAEALNISVERALVLMEAAA